MDNYMSRSNKYDIIKHSSSILLCKWENMLLDLNLILNPPFKAAFCARKWENGLLLEITLELNVSLLPQLTSRLLLAPGKGKTLHPSFFKFCFCIQKWENVALALIQIKLLDSPLRLLFRVYFSLPLLFLTALVNFYMRSRPWPHKNVRLAKPLKLCPL